MAIYALEHLVNTLRAARVAGGLSQREISVKSDLPQSHISKIENGAVDLRTSSLVELARVLDLEVVLVPRRGLPAVRAIVRNLTQAPHGSGEVQRPVPPAYSLDDEDNG
jgi:transcriptional regulator with XRE-family HTH domain